MSVPDRFLWGTATSAFQIEGAVEEDGRGLSSWDVFCHEPGRILDGGTADVAADHYHRWDEDLDLLADLGVDAYRFSISWPRVQPDGRGALNQQGVAFYRRLVEGLKERGITPMATLFHSDLPQALEEAGGWPARRTAEQFAVYATLMYEALAEDVPYWLTINEPWVVAWNGYGYGVHAPGDREPARALAAAHHLLLAHGLATRAMRAVDDRPRIGLALNLNPVRSADGLPVNHEAARRYDCHRHTSMLDPLFGRGYPQLLLDTYAPVCDFGFVREGDLATIAEPLDLLAVNYYAPDTVVHDDVGGRDRWVQVRTAVPADVEVSGLGWEIDPAGLTETLHRIARDYGQIPIYVTENGAAFPDRVRPDGVVDDQPRIRYLARHIDALHDAIAAGIDIRGYFAWTLLDNFEWAEGYSQRFGLVHVDFDTLARTPKESYRWYARYIEASRPASTGTRSGDGRLR